MDEIQLGQKLREVRKAKGISIKDISQQTGLTSSFISQFERGLSKASMDSFLKIVDALGINPSSLYSDETSKNKENQTVKLVRNNSVKANHYSQLTAENIDEYLLSSSNTDVEIYKTIIQPGSTLDNAYAYSNKIEFVTVVDGQLSVKLIDQVIELRAGDSLTIQNNVEKIWENQSDQETVAIWVVYPSK